MFLWKWWHWHCPLGKDGASPSEAAGVLRRVARCKESAAPWNETTEQGRALRGTNLKWKKAVVGIDNKATVFLRTVLHISLWCRFIILIPCSLWTDPLSLCSHPLSTEYCDEVPLEPYFLQSEKTCLLQCLLIGQVLQPFDHPRGPPDKCWVEWDDHFCLHW